jgi:hypothetical protein
LYDLDALGFLEQNTNDDEDEGPPAFIYYKSEKILGKLFRNVEEKQIWSKVHQKTSKSTSSIWGQLLDVVDDELGKYGLDAMVNWHSKMDKAQEIAET